MDQQSGIVDKRPITITVLCILGLIPVALSAAVLIVSVFSINPITWIKGFSIAWLALIFEVVGLVGYWKMRKWGVYIYVIVQVFDLIYGEFSIIAFLLPIMIVSAGLKNLQKMR